MNHLQLTDDAMQGNSSAIEAYIALNKMQKEITECMALIKEDAIKEAIRNGKDYEYTGIKKLEVRNTAGKWDYKGLPNWEAAKEDLKQIEEMHKEAYKLTEKGAQMITNDGEIIEPARYTQGGESLFITI